MARQIHRRLCLLALFALFAVEAAADTTFPEDAPSHHLAFDIRRHDDIIGTHTMAFHNRQGRIEIDTHISVKVTVFTLVAYRFEQHGGEVWEGGRLKSLAMTTDDNGDRFKVAAESSGTRLKVTVNGESALHDAMPLATLWKPTPLQTTQVLDPVDGKPTRISVSDLGQETITVRGKPTATRHLRWDGELKRNLWYDSTGMLVQVHVKGDDGSDIYYILK